MKSGDVEIRGGWVCRWIGPGKMVRRGKTVQRKGYWRKCCTLDDARQGKPVRRLDDGEGEEWKIVRK